MEILQLAWRLRDQIEKYHILDFSKWEEEDLFDSEFGKLKSGLGIYYPKDREDATTPRKSSP